MTSRIFEIESFNDQDGTGTALDVRSKERFSFERSDLADEMDSVCFIGEYVAADVEGNRITNIAATERPDLPLF